MSVKRTYLKSVVFEKQRDRRTTTIEPTIEGNQ